MRPGAQRINVTGTTSPFSPLLAFKHTGLGQVTIVGINTSGSAATLNGTLASLPAVPHLDLYYTSATTNLAAGGSVPVNANGTFSATIPADCVFTLVSAGVPVATNMVLGVLEDTATNLTLLGGGGTVSYAILTNPTNGTLGTLNTNTGVVAYTPNTNYVGADYFRFTVSAGGQQATGAVSLTITAVNDAPIAFSQSVTNGEDTSFAITLTGSDVDGPETNYVVLVGPTNGTLSGVAPNLTYLRRQQLLWSRQLHLQCERWQPDLCGGDGKHHSAASEPAAGGQRRSLRPGWRRGFGHSRARAC